MTETKPPEMAAAARCRSCRSSLHHHLINLGAQPDPDALMPVGADDAAPTAPVDVWICTECGLVQLSGPRPEGPTPIHGHPREAAGSMSSLRLASVIDDLREDGRTVDLDTEDLARIHPGVELLLAGHALSHAEDLDAFLTEVDRVLAPAGRLVVDFHHVLGLAEGQFDVLSHAHRSYFSLHALERLLAAHDLVAVAAMRDSEFGGTLRVVAGRPGRAHPTSAAESSLEEIRRTESEARLASPDGYARLSHDVDLATSRLREFLDEMLAEDRTVAGYGAAARGTALLNLAGVGPDRLPFVADRSPAKQGRQLPGSRIPVVNPAEIDRRRPDDILILPWPMANDIAEHLAGSRAWGARFVVAMPQLRVVSR